MDKDKDREKFILEVDEKDWDDSVIQSQLKNLQGKRVYTKSVAQMQRHVAALDRYDDFSSLKIGVEKYERNEDGESGEYGIAVDEHLHSPNSKTGRPQVIFDHQLTAAKRFLSELRGFGLLADVVGSGKTFEAGVVLSELAVRGDLNSLLIIAPGQVIDNWVDVLENKFGMGKGVLYQVRTEGHEDQLASGGMSLPDELKLNYVVNSANGRPIIVDVSIFARWKMTAAATGFDTIVVDEAHHLSEEEGEFAKAMKLLSQIITTRKNTKKTYCLLLSATPHSGNLEKMFRLWYFIRSMGGNPDDFDEKSDAERSDEYHKEKDFYKNIICTGATNVRDFIRREKLNEFKQGQYIRKLLDDWLKATNKQGFDTYSEYAKSGLIDEFLETGTMFDEKTDVKREVHKRVANAYHNRVLRSIMIRQANTPIASTKFIRSVLYYPMDKPLMKFDVVNDGDVVSLDYTRLNGFNMPQVIVKDKNGKINENFSEKALKNKRRQKKSVNGYFLNDYVEDKAEMTGRTQSDIYSYLVNLILAALKKVSDKENVFTKKRAVNTFYSGVMTKLGEMWDSLAIVPIKHEKNKLGYKYNYLTSVLRSERGSHRIVVFFDYELPETERAFEAVRDALLNSEFKDRVIVSSSDTKANIIDKFNRKGDAILLVDNADFTEGANLQLSNVIVNYQVTPDPLAMDQRIGRIFRLGQKEDVYIHSLANINELEGYALGYFSGIGLMASNSGDATILAGSNSDNMVALRCPVCGASSIQIVPKAEYEEWKRKGDDNLICRHLSLSNCSDPPAKKTEITVRDFKCDKCGHSITRIHGGISGDSEGYQCSSLNEEGERGKLWQSVDAQDEEKRQIYCNKLCAMKHCRKFETPALKKCPVLNAAKARPDIDDAELTFICENCGLRDTKCSPKCYYDSSADGVKACRDCESSKCSPKPYVLNFNSNWEAKCPNCRNGKLKPVVPSTFSLYIKELWKFETDGGINFCTNLKKEMDNVAEIREILKLDKENKR